MPISDHPAEVKVSCKCLGARGFTALFVQHPLRARHAKLDSLRHNHHERLEYSTGMLINDMYQEVFTRRSNDPHTLLRRARVVALPPHQHQLTKLRAATSKRQCTSTPHGGEGPQDRYGTRPSPPARPCCTSHIMATMPLVLRRTSEEGHTPPPHHHSPPRRSLWGLWMTVLVVCSFLSIMLSTIYFPSHYYGPHDRRREASSSLAVLELDALRRRRSRTAPSLGQSKYNDAHAIAWLLSFPNSGTTYTIANVEHMTNHTTATNYAIEALSDVLHPLNPGFDAPFVFSPQLAVPNFVLTKSHCTGYCDNCPYLQDVQTVYSFERGCRTGVVNADCGESVIKPYRGIDDVHKLVHLIRSPLDNLVSRMHLGVQQRREGGSHPESLLAHFTDAPEGLLAWCDHVDAAFAANPDGPVTAVKANAPMGALIDSPSDDAASSSSSTTSSPSHLPPPDLWERLRGVPCHSEIFRYVQFHNLAVEMAEEMLRLESPVHFLHYEDYSTDLDGTSRRLAAYLEQPVQRPPLPFIAGKTYGSLWTAQHRRQVTELIRDLASPTVWALLERYMATEEKEEEEKDEDESRNNNARTRVSAPPVTVRSGRTNRTELVWLLSFPQSGSFMFMNNLMHMSRTQAASHYFPDAAESASSRELVWPDDPLRSPFVWRSSRRKKRASRILTRNHCAGGCLTCKPVESFEAFDLNCRTVPAEGNVSHMEYHLSRVREYWLMVRNPFDVIRSRINRGVLSPLRPANLTKDEGWDLQGTHLALERWCPVADQAYRDEVPASPPPPPAVVPSPSSLRDWAVAAVQGWQRQAECPAGWFASQKRYSRLTHDKVHPEFPLNRTLIQQHYDDLPCFSEWIRIAQWYNYALELTMPRRTLPRRIVRFEEYIPDRTQKLQDLVRALGVEPIVPPLPFDARRARHRILHTPEEARRAAQLFRDVASVETWNLFRPYFENQPWNTVIKAEAEEKEVVVVPNVAA